MTLRHFPYKHPTFGSTKASKSSSHLYVSVYYWWHQYLLRNSDYRKTCAQGGTGPCSDLYKHFGDITSSDFKQWWTEGDRGAKLFADPPKPSIRVVDSDRDGGGSDSLPTRNTLILEVPLDLPINFLVKRFRAVLRKHHDGKRGKQAAQISGALFQVTGKVDVQFLQIALMVWDERQGNPKKPFWQIAQTLRIGGNSLLSDGDVPGEITDKKNVLTATTSRYYRKASEMIKLAGLGKFPHK